MSRTKKIAILAVIAMVLTMLPVQLFAATTAADSTRLYGAGRVETALTVADAGWTTAAAVIVAAADQDNLVDALAAASLAGQENAPILLTFKASLDPAVKAKIAALGAKKVYAVGALSDSVKSELSAISGVTVEVLKGDNRYDTAKAINAKLTSPAGTFVVGSSALADALSVSSFAAANKYAIVIAGTDGKIPAGQSVLGSKTYLVGGAGLVADITGATRLAGADRFETNKVVLQTLAYQYAKVYVANGFNEHLVDSLVAAPLAAKIGAPIVLADNSAIAAKDVINTKVTSTSVIVALGGTGVVSDSVRDTVKYNAPAQFAVSSVEAVDLNQIKVVFNNEVNETNAENTANYQIGTTTLGANDAAVLQADKKTVLVTFYTPVAQGSKNTVTVIAGILNSAGDQTAAKYSKELTFNDVTVPTAVSATATGNKKVTVKFSEPVIMNTIATGVKIDGVSYTAAGGGTVTCGDGAIQGAKDDEAANNIVLGAPAAPYYSQKLVINFNSSLSAGNHTVTIPAGSTGGGGNYLDAANFPVAETTLNFTVDNVTGAPEIKEITAQDNGIVYVTFSRDMNTDAAGVNSVLTAGNFFANDTIPANNPGVPTRVDNRSDKVKMTFGSGIVKAGSNIMIIDKDIMDAWGNKLSTGTDDIRVAFTAGGDTTKPEVSSINLTGNLVAGAKITIKYSEDVNGAFASTAANYKLKDSTGSTITFPVGTTILNKIGTGADSDTWVITLTGMQLSDSTYTLEVKNVIDLATTPNRIDTVAKSFSVGDTIKPTVSAVYESSTANKVIVEFSEAMSASVLELKNYYYIEAGGAIKDLPSGTTISKESDKIVTITFPNGVVVNPLALYGGTGAGSDIISIRVANVTDVAGNIISGGSSDNFVYTVAALPAAKAITISASTVVATVVGSEVWVTFETSEPLSSVDTTGNVTFGAQAIEGYVIAGKQVTVKFTTKAAKDAVKLAGPAATLAITPSAATANSEGRQIANYTAAAAIPVYEDQIAPAIDLVGAALTRNIVATRAVGGDSIAITFTEAIDGTVAGLYSDDFTVEAGGSVLTPVTTTVAGRVLTYTFAAGALGAAGTCNVRAVADKIDIRDLKTDVAKTYNLYVPTATDKTNISI